MCAFKLFALSVYFNGYPVPTYAIGSLVFNFILLIPMCTYNHVNKCTSIRHNPYYCLNATSTPCNYKTLVSGSSLG